MPVVEPDIEAYALAHSSPPTAEMAALVDETRSLGRMSGMMTGPLEGRFLETLVWMSGAKNVLEIGTFTGFGALSMASASPDVRVTTCDVNEETNAIARKHAAAAGLADRIDFRMGPALETIASLDGPFDLVFIDA